MKTVKATRVTFSPEASMLILTTNPKVAVRKARKWFGLKGPAATEVVDCLYNGYTLREA